MEGCLLSYDYLSAVLDVYAWHKFALAESAREVVCMSVSRLAFCRQTYGSLQYGIIQHERLHAAALPTWEHQIGT